MEQNRNKDANVDSNATSTIPFVMMEKCFQSSDMEYVEQLGNRYSTDNKKCVKIKTNEQSLICNICQCVTSSRYVMDIHMNTHTGKKPYKCTLCGMCYANMGTLYRHRQRHAKLTTLTCGECEKGFYSLGDLKRHIKSHQGVKEFICELCNKHFTRKSSLTKHIFTVHEDDDCTYKQSMTKKKVQCQVCRCLFHPDYIKKHMRCHTGEKPHRCPHCMSKFRDFSTLSQHLRIHTNSGQFLCRFCRPNLVFNARIELNNHYSKVHKKKLLIKGYKPPSGEFSNVNQITRPANVNDYISGLSQKKMVNKPCSNTSDNYTKSGNKVMKTNHEPPEKNVLKRNLRIRNKKVSYNEDYDDDLLSAYDLKTTEFKLTNSSLTFDENYKIDGANSIVEKLVINANKSDSKSIIISQQHKINLIKSAKEHKPPWSCDKTVPKSCSLNLRILNTEEIKVEEEVVNENGMDWCTKAAGVKCEFGDGAEEYIALDIKDLTIEKYEKEVENLYMNNVSKQEIIKVEVSENNVGNQIEEYVLDHTDISQLLNDEDYFSEVYVSDKDIVSAVHVI
ncbi:zinc finger protein 583 [Procambarus clarkii]|uniref:zinc finger protein 583 n=1 Tax=Procambarus clarkii TaxID=6728 RepID=UPI003741F92F